MARRRTEAADAGKQALSALRRRVAERLVDALDERDPELLAALHDVGVVRRSWVDDPDGQVMSEPPAEVIERMLERTAERKPSVLASLGLSAVQLLSSSGSRAAGVGEHGTPERLAVVFTDLEGFTSYTARQGDEAAGELLSAHHRAVGPIIRSRGGRTVKRLGDGLLLTFPGPEPAVLAGLELVVAEPGPLRLRVGLHVGEVLVQPEDVIGHVVNVAARVTELAKGGQVLLTSDARDEASDLSSVTFTRVRRRHLKGLDEPVGVCRAMAVSANSQPADDDL
ncbi:MAG: adenylate/guanylate cyclase domain-containing protein [Acidimicrobiales bacterium]